MWNNAKCWRTDIIRVCTFGGPPPPDTDPDSFYYQKAEQAYNTPQDEEEADCHDGIDVPKFLAALVLFTYGRLDVVPFILSQNFDPRVNLKEFKHCVWALIPFPDQIRQEVRRHYPDNALLWLEKSASRLRFNPEVRHYEIT